MTITICGHGRDVLSLALEDLAHLDSDTVVELARMPEALPEWRGAVLDLADSAKLAAMLAEEGRRLGFDAGTLGGSDRRDFCVYHWPNDTHPNESPWLEIRFGLYGRFRRAPTVELPPLQARALLLAWLQLPNGAHEDAVKVLRGNRADPDELLNTIPAREYPELRHFDPSPET